MTARTSMPWPRPDQFGLAVISAVHWVKPRTKTRSKKSSSGLTVSRWRSSTRRRGVCESEGSVGILRLRVGAPVVGVGDVIAPGGRAAGDGEVGHEVVVAGAVPVLLRVVGVVDVAGAELDDVVAAPLDEPAAFGHVEGLSTVVGVPGGAGAGSEVNGADVQRRVVLGLD